MPCFLLATNCAITDFDEPVSTYATWRCRSMASENSPSPWAASGAHEILALTAPAMRSTSAARLASTLPVARTRTPDTMKIELAPFDFHGMFSA
jgi:hypothetical protein